MKQLGRLENLKREMDRLNVDVVGISEVQWDEKKNDFCLGDFRITNSASNKGQAGVGFVKSKKVGTKYSIEVGMHSDRIIIIRIKSEPKPTTIFNIYMPTSACDDYKVEHVFEGIDE